MKYIALDIETTGLDPRTSSVLQIACVAENSAPYRDAVDDLPSLNIYVDQPRDIQGSLVALDMNRDLISRLVKKDIPEGATLCRDEAEAWERVKDFLLDHCEGSKAVIAGKNVAGFDMQFMPPDVKALCHHRTLDPAALYVDWQNDIVPPGLDKCLARCGIVGGERHDALEDARDVIRVLRRSYGA
jgi:oligoribonuclease (3'-5' exoribonuclease)